MEFFNVIKANLTGYFGNLRDSISEVLEMPLYKLLSFINIFLIIILWLSTYYINAIVSQELIVLHYNIDFGVNLIGPARSLYLFPLASMYIFLANWTLTVLIRQDRKFFAYFFILGSISAGAFLLLALGSLYLVNFS